MKKFIVLSIVLLMLVGFGITSSAAELARVDLFAGQNIRVGEVIVKVIVIGDESFLEVKYEVMDGGEWELLDTHLYLGAEPPTKSAPGWFQHGPDNAEVVDNGKRYLFLLKDLPEGVTTLYIATHAEVRKPEINPDTGELIYQEETAWAIGVGETDEGENFQCIRPCKNWAMYFEFTSPRPSS